MIELELLNNKKPKKYPILLITLISVIILLILSINIYSYDKYKTIAITENINNKCILNVSLPYNKISNLNNSFIIHKNNKYIINKVSYNKTYIENNIPYEDISITLNSECKEKIIDINILNNKQRIITKIINIIREA